MTTIRSGSHLDFGRRHRARSGWTGRGALSVFVFERVSLERNAPPSPGTVRYMGLVDEMVWQHLWRPCAIDTWLCCGHDVQYRR